MAKIEGGHQNIGSNIELNKIIYLAGTSIFELHISLYKILFFAF